MNGSDMAQKFEGIREAQAEYYKDLFEQHGASVDAVASGLQVYKELRYAKICEVFDDAPFSVHDVGFGLAHFYDFLQDRFGPGQVEYSGSEVTSEFVDHCRDAYPDSEFLLRDITEIDPPDEAYDYVVMTGTFYHRRDVAPRDFAAYFANALENAFRMCRRAVAFNLVSPYVEYETDDLFYLDMESVLSTVLSLSRFFTIDHSTPLYEHTVGVFKPEFVSERYPEAAFDKYFKRDGDHRANVDGSVASKVEDTSRYDAGAEES